MNLYIRGQELYHQTLTLYLRTPHIYTSDRNMPWFATLKNICIIPPTMIFIPPTTRFIPQNIKFIPPKSRIYTPTGFVQSPVAAVLAGLS